MFLEDKSGRKFGAKGLKDKDAKVRPKSSMRTVSSIWVTMLVN